MGLEAIGPGARGGEAPAAISGGDGHSRPDLDEIREVPAENRALFLEYIRENRECSVKEAAEAAGVRRRDVKVLLRTDQEFAEDYATARGRGVEQIHSQMVKLAIEGVDEPIVSMGQVVATKKVYSERLLQVMFNALTPEGRATLGNKIGLEINTGGGDVKLQEGVPLSDVAAFMREHVPGFQAQLEGEEQAGEIVDVTDEPLDD